MVYILRDKSITVTYRGGISRRLKWWLPKICENQQNRRKNVEFGRGFGKFGVDKYVILFYTICKAKCIRIGGEVRFYKNKEGGVAQWQNSIHHI